MIDSQRPQPDEVEHLMLNAQLRNELEPFLDESVNLLDFRRLPTPRENEYLASMLAWGESSRAAHSELVRARVSVAAS